MNNKTLTGEDIGNLLLQSIKEMKAGKIGRQRVIELTPVAEARKKTGLSQDDFSTLLGVSVRTLQEWEQGRRTPSKAAQTLIKVANKHPEALLDL